MASPRPWSQTILPTQNITRVNQTSQSFTNKIYPSQPLIISNANLIDEAQANLNIKENLLVELNTNQENVQENVNLEQNDVPETAVIIPTDSVENDTDYAEELPSEPQPCLSPEPTAPENSPSPEVRIPENSTKLMTPIINPITPVEFVENIQRIKSSKVQQQNPNNNINIEDNPQQIKPPSRQRKKKWYFLRGGIVGLFCLSMFLGQDWMIQSCKYTSLNDTF